MMWMSPVNGCSFADAGARTGKMPARCALRTPILLLSALDGTQTVTAAMAAVQERSGSRVAVSGYTPAYPIGNILLTTCGTIIVVSSWRADVAGGARYQANEQGNEQREESNGILATCADHRGAGESRVRSEHGSSDRTGTERNVGERATGVVEQARRSAEPAQSMPAAGGRAWSFRPHGKTLHAAVPLRPPCAETDPPSAVSSAIGSRRGPVLSRRMTCGSGRPVRCS